jgi:hypothetical protein
MSRFAADFLPLSAGDLFDMSGEMPPALRVIMNVPPDYEGGVFKFGRGGSDVEERERFETQDKLKEILIERYRNQCQARLAGIRRNRKLSIISVVRQTVEVDDGVTMEYESLWGREYVTLIFQERLVRKLLDLLSGGGACMLVLYGENKIAAIPMKTLTTPKVVYTATSRTSFGTPPRWFPSCGPGYYQVAQIKPSKNIHAMSTQIDFSGHSVQPANDWFMQYVYNTAFSLFNNAQACTPLKRTGITLDWEQGEISDHVIYGYHLATSSSASPYGYMFFSDLSVGENGTSTWDDFGYSIFWKREHRSGGLGPLWGAWEVGFGPYSDAPWWVYTGPVINVSPSGEIYNERGDVFSTDKTGGVKIKTPGDTTSTVEITRLGLDAPEVVGHLPGWPAYDPITYAPLPDITTSYLLALSVGTDGKIADTWTFIGDSTAPAVDIRQPILTQKGKLDIFDTKVKSVSAADFKSAGDGISVFAINFPYSISDDLNKQWAVMDDGQNEVRSTNKEYYAFGWDTAEFPLQSCKITSPYESFDAPAGKFAFQGWLHLSNGEHILQAFILRSNPSTFKRYIYLDGKDYGKTLAGALKCSIDDIRAIYFDIKLSDIKKLK